MRGRVGVTFQGRGFDSHKHDSRGILQLYFQRKRGRMGPKISGIMKAACCPMARLSSLDPEVCGLIPAGGACMNFGFLIFSSLFVVR